MHSKKAKLFGKSHILKILIFWLIIYIIYINARDSGWKFVEIISKIILIITIIPFALVLGIILLVIAAFIIFMLIALLLGKKYRKKSDENVVDAEFSMRE